MPTVSGPVDSNGNITIPAEGGAFIPIRRYDLSDPPVAIDISAIPMRFVVKGRLDIVVPVDPGFAQGKLLTITETQADQLSTKGSSFQLLDETVLSVPIPLWTGTIKRGS